MPIVVGEVILLPQARHLRDMFSQVALYTYTNGKDGLRTTHNVPDTPADVGRIGAYLVGMGNKHLPGHFALACAPTLELLRLLNESMLGGLQDITHWKVYETDDGGVNVFISYGKVSGSRCIVRMAPEEASEIVTEIKALLATAEKPKEVAAPKESKEKPKEVVAYGHKVTWADKTINAYTRGVLLRCEIDGTILKLPNEQLDHGLYTDVKKVVTLWGGKWSTSDQGFVFPEDPTSKLNQALSTGTVTDQRKLRQAFYTPDDVATVVAKHADVRGRRVLEPSAGAGALVRACEAAGAVYVLCIELEPRCAAQLQAPNREVRIGNFLEVPCRPMFERVVMNPPFTKGQIVKHIERAMLWLVPGGELYAIVTDKEEPKLTPLEPECLVRFPAGAFKSSGTTVATRLIRIRN